MKNMKMTKVIGFLLILVAMIYLCLPVSAETIIDENRLGSITVTLRDGQNKEPVKNAEITIYKVADAKNINNNLMFEFVPDFENCGFSIEDYNKPEFAESFTDYITQNSIPGITLTTNENGVVTFNGIAHGIYLVVQHKTVENFSAFTPFVLAIPITQDNSWVYDVSANPKIESIHYTDITVKKVWNDDNGAGATKRPDSVKIQLLSGNNVIETVVLSEKNGWTHTWTDMVQKDNYSVKEVDVPKGYKVTYKQNGFDFNAINTATLVQTGQLNWPIPTLIVAGLLLIMVGYILCSRGKRNEK